MYAIYSRYLNLYVYKICFTQIRISYESRHPMPIMEITEFLSRSTLQTYLFLLNDY